MTPLNIVIGLLAVGLGIYLGRPRRYTRPLDEVDKAFEEGRGRKEWTKRHFTPLDLLRNKSKGSERRREGVRTPFRTVAPGKKRSVVSKDDSDGPPQVKLGK